MKRTNVVLDEKLLDEAKRLSGQPTYSATINHALRELVRLNNIAEGLKILGGSHAWEGNLEEMRRDRQFDAPARQPEAQRRKARRGSR
jgi:Arc/MetJ family transcription regulator